MFLAAIGLLLYSLRDAEGFNMIWRYFAWVNQTLAVFTLWALTVFLTLARKPYMLTLASGSVHDCCLLYVYLHCSRRVGSFANNSL